VSDEFPHVAKGTEDDPVHVRAEEQALGTEKDPVHVRSDTLPASFVIRLFLLGWALAVMIPLIAVGGLRWYDQDHRISESTRLARELRRTQIELRRFVAEQCIQAETRDVANVQTNGAILNLLSDLESTPELRSFRQALIDANRLLEPPGEQDCQPGPGVSQP
jgi:hypothetical protein